MARSARSWFTRWRARSRSVLARSYSSWEMVAWRSRSALRLNSSPAMARVASDWRSRAWTESSSVGRWPLRRSASVSSAERRRMAASSTAARSNSRSRAKSGRARRDLLPPGHGHALELPGQRRGHVHEIALHIALEGVGPVLAAGGEEQGGQQQGRERLHYFPESRARSCGFLRILPPGPHGPPRTGASCVRPGPARRTGRRLSGTGWPDGAMIPRKSMVRSMESASGRMFPASWPRRTSPATASRKASMCRKSLSRFSGRCW